MLHVWIDQDLCTGDGLCTDHCPDLFVLLEDGISYVQADGEALNDPGGPGSMAPVAPHQVGEAVAAAEDCPGECIFLEELRSSDMDGHAAIGTGPLRDGWPP